MDKQKLQTTLEQLHAELEQVESVDPAAQILLRDLQADIQALLAQADPGAEHYQPLGTRLDTAIERFAASHPGLTLSMQQALDILSRAGI